ncbi:MAG: tetratricopeptide repeat protein [Candidatus Omnitrophica bacterium]|nr:tetratricopeptide repeat protein [Candidatus Omnitrophota bacterium]
MAKKAYEDAFYEVSLGLLERFLKNYPDSTLAPEAKLLTGECYYHQNRFLEALKEFELIQNDPQAKNIRDAVLYWIAEVHFKGNNFSKSEDYYKMVIEQFPKSTYVPGAYYSLGFCLFQEHKYADALGYFKTVLEKYPREPQAKDAAFKLVETLYNLKDYTALKDKLKEYIKVYSKDASRLPYLYFYQAEADFYLEDFSQAIDSYNKVIKSTDDDKIQALSKLGLAWGYLKLKRYKEAEQAFSQIDTASLEKRSVDVLLLGKAVLMAETSRVNEAGSIYDQLISSTQDPLVLVQAYLGKAEAFYNAADYVKAISVYKEALAKVDTANTPGEIVDKLHHSLAWAYLKHGDFKEAIKEFQQIVKESDDKIFKVSALCQIGDTYQDSGNYAKAEETYESILRDYPDSLYSDYVQYQLGLNMLKSSNYDGAALAFLALKKNFPNSKLLDDADYALGLTYFQKQDYNSSRDIFLRFDQEFKDSPLKPEALYLLGSSLFNLTKYNEAIDVFKNIARLYGQDRELAQKAEFEIADCYYQLGNESEAMNRFKALRAKYPDSNLTAETVWWLGQYYYRHNDLNLARRYLNSLIQDFPSSNLVPDAYYALGSSYEDDGRTDEALENFRKVLELRKSDLAGQAALAIADIYAKQENSEAAFKGYNDILKGYPNLSGLIYPKIADLYFKNGNFGQAIDYYRKSMDLVPVREMPGIQFKIGESLQAEGKLDEAIEEYLKTTYLYADNNALVVKSLLRVASIYENKQNFKEAANIYKKISSMDVEEAKFAKERLELIKKEQK